MNNISVLFFAQTRELIGTANLIYECESISVAELIDRLAQKGEKWSYALKEKTILCAVNKVMVDSNFMVKAGDEVAFFPPVTGG